MTLAILCLTANLYWEARGEPTAGQIAVAAVTMARAEGDPGRVCRVVKAPKQFSWTNGKTKKVTDWRSWHRAKRIAHASIHGRLWDNTNGATHFHAKWVKPGWSKRMVRVATIGNHHFYKKTG